MLNELSGCEVTAICEPSIENILRQPKAFLPPLVTADYQTFLSSGIDAVVIATPARTHYQLVMQALRSNKHVLVEKPFATNTEDAVAMIDAAQRRGLSLLVGHTYVYHPAVEYLRDVIESGELGKLRYVHTARLNFGILQPDVDVLWDLAPQTLLDLAPRIVRLQYPFQELRTQDQAPAAGNESRCFFTRLLGTEQKHDHAPGGAGLPPECVRACSGCIGIPADQEAENIIHPK